MKVLVADKFEAVGIEGLQALGVEVLYKPDWKGDELAKGIRDSEAEILVVRSTKVTADMMDAEHLAVIIRAGAGYNTIDVAAASDHGILVTNCPGKNSQAVAELAFALMLACDRHVADCVADIRSGKWNKKAYSKAKGLYGRTLGLVGMGKIGQEMIVRAKAFGMNVVAFSRWMTPDVAAALGIGRAASAEELAAMSDFVSVHVSLTPETRGMLGSKFFRAMKDGGVFVNTSRSEVVDEAAMIEELRSGRIVAGLDVFSGEPEIAEGDCGTSELSSLPNAYITHHIGASTEQAQEAIAAETVRIVREYKATGIVPNVVNVKKAEAATHVLVVRHVEHGGVQPLLFQILKDEGISIQEMEHIVLGSAKAAITQISVDKEPSASALTLMKLNENIFDASVFGIEQPALAG